MCCAIAFGFGAALRCVVLSGMVLRCAVAEHAQWHTYQVI